MAFDPSSAQEVKAFDPNSAREYVAPQAASPSSTLDNIANSGIVTGINAVGGGAQTGIANTIGTAIGSQKVTDALSPPQHVQNAMAEDPNLAMAGKAAGYIGAGAAAVGGAAEAGAAMFGEGMLTSLGANAVAGAALAGPGNRTLGGVLGAGTALVAPVLSSTSNYLAKSLTLDSRVKSLVSEINGKIEGTPDVVAAKSQANMWNTVDSTDKQNFSALDSKAATKISTIPQQASDQAKLILQKYEDPKVLGNLTGPQRDIVQQIADWSKQETKTIPSSSLVNASGNPLQGEVNQVINSSTKFSLAELQGARKGLDQAISQAFDQSENGAISKGIAKDLLSIRAPLEQDLLGAADKAGLKDQYLNANNFYKQSVLPMINTGARDTADALANAGTKPLDADKITDGLINRYVNPNKPEVTKTFLNSLDPVGRQAVEAQVVNNALKKATNNIDNIDPLVFKTNIQTVQKQLGDVLSPNTNKMLNGLNKAIDQGTTLLGMKLDMAKIQTGYKIGAGASALGAITYGAGGGVAVGIGTVALGLNALVKTKFGQQMLIRAGTKGGEEVGKQLVSGLLIQGALATTPPDIKSQGAVQ